MVMSYWVFKPKQWRPLRLSNRPSTVRAWEREHNSLCGVRLVILYKLNQERFGRIARLGSVPAQVCLFVVQVEATATVVLQRCLTGE